MLATPTQCCIRAGTPTGVVLQGGAVWIKVLELQIDLTIDSRW